MPVFSLKLTADSENIESISNEKVGRWCVFCVPNDFHTFFHAVLFLSYFFLVSFFSLLDVEMDAMLPDRHRHSLLQLRTNPISLMKSDCCLLICPNGCVHAGA